MQVLCKFCSSGKIVKRGIRKLKTGKKQIYFCKNCNKRFSEGLSKKRFNFKIILNAVCSYNQGYSYEEVRDVINRKNKVDISTTSISRWVKEFDLGYDNIKSKIVKKSDYPLVVGRIFKHSGLIYNFKYHKGKLEMFGKFPGLKNFIFSLSKGVDGKYFTSSSERCSQIKEEASLNVKIFDNTKLNKVIGDALRPIKNNKQRHSIVENLMLHCDRDTMAVEVPVWYWDKSKNKGICGHIDILQVKYGKVWILDYKPGAGDEDVDKVVSQLFSYALALSFRTGVSLRNIKCGYFDENKTYVFDADKVKFS